MRLRDEFGPLYRDADFAAPFPARGQPALPPWRLALVTVPQFLEGLSDWQAADATYGGPCAPASIESTRWGWS